MSIMQICMWMFIGIVIILVLSGIVSKIIVGTNKKKISNIQNIYLGKLENTDASIKDAMKYLQLTNGLDSIKGEIR